MRGGGWKGRLEGRVRGVLYLLVHVWVASQLLDGDRW
jgi:hypothetical protein